MNDSKLTTQAMTPEQILVDRDIRRGSVSALLALTGGRAEDSELIDGYLKILADVPIDILDEACDRITRGWTSADHYGSPKPADVLQSCRKIRIERIELKREQDRTKTWDELKDRKLTPEVAKHELARVASIDLPDTDPRDQSLARRGELARRASLRRIARVDPNKAEDAEYHRLRDPIDEARGSVPGFQAAAAAKGTV